MITTLAPAKINLYLHIIGQRGDGYHLLDSLVAFSNIGDDIALIASNNWRLKVQGAFAAMLPQNCADNIVLKAAISAANDMGFDKKYLIFLNKSLPVAAGIGGGSANAAAIIKILENLCGKKINDHIALSLGSDVPVCMNGQAAYISGIGEKIDKVEGFTQSGIILINPLLEISTAKIFQTIKLNGFHAAIDHKKSFNDFDDLIGFLQNTTNDLQSFVSMAAAPVSTILNCLTAQPEVAIARMSGSGATCFGLTKTPAIAREVAARLNKQFPLWWIKSGIIY